MFSHVRKVLPVARSEPSGFGTLLNIGGNSFGDLTSLLEIFAHSRND
jgi:hypothetical protein